ncbi:MAG: hypothetical protein MJ070_10025 [Lachnospiraceae bacterium]|nr:hypothetical protein [Lachnospiraceae bacterium]
MTQALTEFRCFGGANTADGFKSFFGELTGRVSYLYVIKGGPGTGKSFFMNLVKEEAQKRGLQTELIYCASDPSSLDGILLPSLGIGVFDGTAPHTLDPGLPAVDGEWIRFDSFLDEKALAPKREKLEALAARKKALYDHVTGEALIYAAADREITDAVSEALDTVKAERAAERLLKRCLSGKEGGCRTVQVSSIGMRGSVRFPTLDMSAEEIRPIFGRGADVFLSLLFRLAEAAGTETVVSYHPIVPGKPTELFFPDKGVLFTLRERKNGENGINMDRFLIRSVLRQNRSAIRALNRIRAEALAEITARYGAIADCHFEIERIYGSALDVRAKEEYSEELIAKIFSSPKR